jgi:hypothetical protein
MFDFPAAPVAGDVVFNGSARYVWDSVKWTFEYVPPPPPPPTLISLAPNTAVCLSPDVTVTAAGTDFAATTEILVDGVAQATTFVSATEVTYVATSSQQATALTVTVTVRNGATAGVGSVPFEFTAAPLTLDRQIGNYDANVNRIMYPPNWLPPGSPPAYAHPEGPLQPASNFQRGDFLNVTGGGTCPPTNPPRTANYPLVVDNELVGDGAVWWVCNNGIPV